MLDLRLHYKKQFVGKRTYLTHYGVRKTPSFNGKHNATRVKTLILLSSSPSTHYTLAEIYQLTGCNYDTLKRSLTKWCRWHYLTYKLNKYGIREYRILARGVKYLKAWQALIPQRWYYDVAEAIRYAHKQLEVNGGTKC